MPELPEVESTCLVLRPLLLGQRILSCHATVDRLRTALHPKELTRRLAGRVVKDLRRRAKYLILEVDGAQALLLHLGMTGSLSWARTSEAQRKHDRLAIAFACGYELRLHDPRRFGSAEPVYLPYPGAQPQELDQLGPEPFAATFDATYLYSRARGRSLAVKNFIMDQRTVAGVGNIYASEALYRSGVRPGRAAGRVRRHEYDLLIQELAGLLRESIDAGGTTISDYRVDGQPGRYVARLQVYGREGQACMRTNCSGEIRRKVLGGRSSFYCPLCQR